jgi:hypothetical protein
VESESDDVEGSSDVLVGERRWMPALAWCVREYSGKSW